MIKILTLGFIITAFCSCCSVSLTNVATFGKASEVVDLSMDHDQDPTVSNLQAD